MTFASQVSASISHSLYVCILPGTYAIAFNIVQTMTMSRKVNRSERSHALWLLHDAVEKWKKESGEREKEGYVFSLITLSFSSTRMSWKELHCIRTIVELPASNCLASFQNHAYILTVFLLTFSEYSMLQLSHDKCNKYVFVLLFIVLISCFDSFTFEKTSFSNFSKKWKIQSKHEGNRLPIRSLTASKKKVSLSDFYDRYHKKAN